jgi:hypothetical protein
MKLCKDCKHIELPIKTFSECKHPKNMTTNTVTGDPKYKHSASGQRIGGWLYSLLSPCCGKAGKWFEPKYVPARERSL